MFLNLWNSYRKDDKDFTKYQFKFRRKYKANGYAAPYGDSPLDNEIVGYLAGSVEEKGSYELIQYAELNNMLVAEEYRGTGIGKQLIDAFKEYCKSKNIYDIRVVASYKNKDAINFYHKNGFKDFNLTLTMNIDS